jgi:hypothetical protein
MRRSVLISNLSARRRVRIRYPDETPVGSLHRDAESLNALWNMAESTVGDPRGFGVIEAAEGSRVVAVLARLTSEESR